MATNHALNKGIDWRVEQIRSRRVHLQPQLDQYVYFQVRESTVYLRKIWRVLIGELSGFRFRFLFAKLLLAPLPIHVGSRIRVYVLRLIGFRLGAGCVMWGMPIITGNKDMYTNLQVGRECWFNVNCLLDLGAPITIGDRVAIGHQVMILTTSHEIGTALRRAATVETRAISIGSGVWLGARCIILPGIRIGEGAIVAAGAVVSRDVPPNTMVGGVPARVIKSLSDATTTEKGALRQHMTIET